MFARFRAEVYGVLTARLPDIPIWNEIPDDINEVPCLVVGRPGGQATSIQVVMDLTLEVFVIGRRQQAGASEDELLDLVDATFDALGGTRGTKTSAGETVAVARVLPRVLTVAGVDVPAFTIEVEASATTC